MTKEEMTCTIKEEETRLYEELRVSEEKYGFCCETTSLFRAEWATMYRLCEKLQIR